MTYFDAYSSVFSMCACGSVFFLSVHVVLWECFCCILPICIFMFLDVSSCAYFPVSFFIISMCN